MTPEAQRIAIAEAMGWRVFVAYNEDYRVTKEGGERMLLPDYPEDLNAMHEAEKTLGQNWHTYCHKLHAVVTNDNPGLCHVDFEALKCFRCLSATASQRAEAFLRTLNLWKD